MRAMSDDLEAFREVYQEQLLKKSGVRLDDLLQISPLQGRKKKIILKRTKFLIELREIYKVDSLGAKIFLPKGVLSCGRFQINLMGRSANDQEGKCSRFLLESLDQIPFKINGVLAFSAYLERGDLVELGYNRLQFMSEGQDESPLSQVEISQEAIESCLNILIEGETGTGKTYLARKIHENSKRKGRFVHINLSSFSKSLIESELFGHVKGAFTGAYSDKIGAFREANYGTLFLDEIDSLPKEIQTKLLLFLDSGHVRPVGGSEDKKIEVRLIFAAGKKIKSLVESDEMRKDFFYRLKSGFDLELRPLREEIGKIKNFCFDFAAKRSKGISYSLIDFYTTLSWPGNYRQLKSHLEKKIILGKGQKLIYDEFDKQLLESSHLEESLLREEKFCSLEKLKYEYCCRVLAYFGQNLKMSSEVLRVSTKTLRGIQRKMQNL